jgi:hypothetical protein
VEANARSFAGVGPTSAGDDVASLQNQLKSAGYFPNDQLQSEYAAWQPVIPEVPTEGIYDKTTESAVRELQRRNGLKTTGVVDAETDRAIRLRTCGVPESGAVHRSKSKGDKFALLGGKWNRSLVTWALDNGGTAGLDRTTVKNIVAQAFSVWGVQANVLFQEADPNADPSADIRLSFGPLPGNDLGLTTGTPGVTSVVTFRSDATWSVGAGPESGKFHFPSIALHEIGHALGLAHSSIVGANMLPSFNQNEARPVNADDVTAISVLYNQWGNASRQQSPLPGSARDIGIGANNAVWMISATAATGGSKIFKWETNQWLEASGNGGAVRIAVAPDGVPWVVANNGTIYTHSANRTSGAWSVKPGCARDIGIGAEGSVWVTGCATPNAPIYKWNGSDWSHESANGLGVAISVDNLGRPWVANSGGFIYRRSSAATNAGVWNQVAAGTAPGAPAIGATDISLSPSGEAYIISNQSSAGGYAIYAWDEQPQIDNGDQQAPAKSIWINLPGGATSIAAGPNDVWVTNVANLIYKQIKITL